MADHQYGSGNRSNSIFSDDDRDYRGRGDGEQRGGQRPQSQGDDRGFFSKAGDEVRSWFGDDEAERRREQDARRYEREHGESGRYSGGGHEDQWRGGPPQDRGYAGTGAQARDYERNRFNRGDDGRDDGDGWERVSYGQGEQSPGQQGGRYGEGQYGQSSFGDGNHGNQGYGGSTFGQAGRGQSYGANRNQSGHYGSEQDYGRAGGGSNDQAQSFGGSPHDESYRRWRDQQMQALDREYDEYCRHRQSQFEQDFHGFRQTRQQGGEADGGQMSAGQAGGSQATDSTQTSGQQTAGATTTAAGAGSATTSSTGSSGDADAAKDSGTKGGKSA